MNQPIQNKSVYTGIALAIVAVIIWSGNFVIARGVYKQIPPLSLAFFRWMTASIIIIPFCIRPARKEFRYVMQSWKLILFSAITGISLFNTFIYIGAHYTTAINLALIGNTVSPVVSVLLAAFYLKEKITRLKIAGMFLCCCGILFLLAQGKLHNLLSLHFSIGDGWMVLAACSFAIYNILARKKPATISPVFFLGITFVTGTLLLLPFYLVESVHTHFTWTPNLWLVILYLGAGASVISFFCWNYAIRSIGAGRTALFGNLIPLFSSMEAIIVLHEPFTTIHWISMTLIFAGLLLANGQLIKKEAVVN